MAGTRDAVDGTVVKDGLVGHGGLCCDEVVIT